MLVADKAQLLAPAVAGEVLDEAPQTLARRHDGPDVPWPQTRACGVIATQRLPKLAKKRRGRGPGEISRFTRHIRREDETMPGRHQIGVVDRLRRARK
jgi:hypothetical protein